MDDLMTASDSGAYRVLARKYRQTTFADLKGQEALVRTLSNAFAQGRVAHAFILTGVRGVGKTTTARIVAKGLNCLSADGPTVDPCWHLRQLSGDHRGPPCRYPRNGRRQPHRR